MARRSATTVMAAIAWVLITAALVTATRAVAAECTLEPRAQCFEIESASASLSTPEAGAHADFATTFQLNGNPEEPDGFFEQPRPWGNLKDLSVTIPPGVVGNPAAFPKCSAAQLTTIFAAGGQPGPGKCPPDSQVGIVKLGSYENLANPPGWPEPLYNMPSPGGDVVARLGFVAALYPVFIDLRVDPSRGYALTASVTDAPALAQPTGSTVTVWGVPADSSHDGDRIDVPRTVIQAFVCSTSGECPGAPRESGLEPQPFMSNPTSCGQREPLDFSADTYQLPGHVVHRAAELPEIVDCAEVPFEPTMSLRPTSRRAGGPSGMNVELTVPQAGLASPGALASAHLRKAIVTLPEGVTLNAGAAQGLGSCSEAQIGLVSSNPIRFNGADPSCPDTSKVGNVRITTPVLEDPLEGSLYVASQGENPFRSLLAGYLVAKGKGILIKQAGRFDLDQRTGRITATFEDNPQQPFSRLEMHFNGGARGVLAMPEACGAYRSTYELTPWSGNPPVSGSSEFTIDEGCGGDTFAPKLTAGTTKPLAGAFAPFLARITREEGQQNLAGIAMSLPPGELAKLAGVAICPEAQAASGDCPAGSQIGAVDVAVGAGTLPLWIPQAGKDPTSVHLAGPFEGAPYSLVVEVPAQAGPFDLGTVVTRAAIDVDPDTTQVTVTSDSLPQILEGVPVSYRAVQVDVERPEFTLNPTSCEAMSVGTRLTSSQGLVATPESRFQVGGCGGLGFEPKLDLRLKGKTNRGAHPALRAVLKMPRRGANIRRARVALPRSEFLDQGHIQTVCTRVQFAAEECPAGSVYGHAQAITPLLDEPLEGPVYLRSSSNQLPDLVADLRGQIHVVVDGRIDSAKGGGIRTTFTAVPDAPVTKFVLSMKGGSKGLLVNSVNLCGRAQFAEASFAAQSGKVRHLQPRMRSSCPRK